MATLKLHLHFCVLLVVSFLYCFWNRRISNWKNDHWPFPFCKKELGTGWNCMWHQAEA